MWLKYSIWTNAARIKVNINIFLCWQASLTEWTPCQQCIKKKHLQAASFPLVFLSPLLQKPGRAFEGIHGSSNTESLVGESWHFWNSLFNYNSLGQGWWKILGEETGGETSVPEEAPPRPPPLERVAAESPSIHAFTTVLAKGLMRSSHCFTLSSTTFPPK